MTLKEKLAGIQLELKVHKGQKNAFGGYNYRSAEDILEAIKPFEDKYKVLFQITENFIEFSGYIGIESRAILHDLDDLEQTLMSTGTAIIDFNAKGMQNPQRTGSASSYAKKYALGNLLLIDDTKDSDASNTHGKESSKEVLTKKHPRYKGALKAVLEGKTTVAAIKKNFELAEGVEETLNKAKLI